MPDWSVETWTAVVSAATAVASLAVLLFQRGADSHRNRALAEGLALLKEATTAYRADLEHVRSQLGAVQERPKDLHLKQVEVAAARERRLESDRKWKAALDVFDRLGQE